MVTSAIVCVGGGSLLELSSKIPQVPILIAKASIFSSFVTLCCGRCYAVCLMAGGGLYCKDGALCTLQSITVPQPGGR